MGCGGSKSVDKKGPLGGARIVFVLGGPGAGKGTQCERIVAKYGYKHLSTGDLLRDEVKAGTELGKTCEALMKEGKLVPQEVIIGLLKDQMVKSGAKSFLIDGFPRAMDQDAMFEKMIKPADAVLFFDVPEATMEERLLKRGETSGRADDNAETIRKRFKTFVDQSIAVVDKYTAKGNCHKISAVPGPEEVFAEVAAALDAAEAKWRKEDAVEMAKSMVVPPVPGALPKDASIVFVLGGPGAGKGTQCERIVRDYGFTHLSAGDLLRDEVKSESEVGKACATLMKEGALVPLPAPGPPSTNTMDASLGSTPGTGGTTMDLAISTASSLRHLASAASSAAATSAKTSSGPGTAEILWQLPLAVYLSTTAIDWSTKVLKRLRMVSALSSARPDVSPRFSSRSSIVASGTSKNSTASAGLIIFSNIASWSIARGKPSIRKDLAPDLTIWSFSRPMMTSWGTSLPSFISASQVLPSSVPALTSSRSRSPVERCL